MIVSVAVKIPTDSRTYTHPVDFKIRLTLPPPPFPPYNQLVRSTSTCETDRGSLRDRNHRVTKNAMCDRFYRGFNHYVIHSFVSAGECEPEVCHERGTCLLNKDGYKCQCHPGYMGDQCEFREY